jgi:GR25 family glycosyltransferase involved in LPS biosynthesis
MSSYFHFFFLNLKNNKKKMELPVRLIYINLASRNDRRELMETALRSRFQTVPYERMEAVRPDADLLLQYNREGRLTNLDYLRVLSNETSFLTIGSVGCFASHIALWKIAVEKNTILVVLEDDVILRDDVERCLLDGLQSTQDFRIAYLGQPLEQWKEHASEYNDYFWKITDGYYGTFGYVIHPSHAAFLLDRLERIPMTEHVDNAMLRVQSSECVPVLLFKTMLLTTPTDPGRDSDVICSRRRQRRRWRMNQSPQQQKIPKIFHFINHPRVNEQIRHWQGLHQDYQCVLVNEEIVPSTGGFYVAPNLLCHRNLHPYLQSSAIDFDSVYIDQSSSLFYGKAPSPSPSSSSVKTTLFLPPWIIGHQQHSFFFIDLKI